MTSTVERHTASIGDEDSWWAGPDAAPTPDAADVARRTYTDEAGANALDRLSNALTDLDLATQETDAMVSDATRYLEERLDVATMVETVTLVQDLKRRLAVVEAYVTRRAALTAVEVGAPREGALPDGRTWTLKRGSTRKAWDHDEWKRDARAAVLEAQGIGTVLVDPSTGEEVNPYDLLAAVQEVHGSTGPRVGQLRKVGLDPDDYCEVLPGIWSVTALAPSDDPADD